MVDLTAFYTGTTDPLRGNYEDYAAEGKIHSQLMIVSLVVLQRLRVYMKQKLIFIIKKDVDTNVKKIGKKLLITTIWQ